ncbi:MAG TPA: helix-turn-helix domain-containing protein [Candidatus Angelobacter sp.]|nr:helix-turn-helix domain-containing protein [Candidatus Angelobacter sp.]
MELKSKREAAEMLGLSTRGVERAVRRGHLAVQYQPGKHGRTAWFAATDLRHYRQIQQAKFSVGFTSGIPQAPGDPGLTIGNVTPMVDVKPWPEKKTAHPKKESKAVRIAEQLALTLKEAAQLAGLPRIFIDQSVEAGKLKAFKIGGSFYVKRSDLEAFIQSL